MLTLFKKSNFEYGSNENVFIVKARGFVFDNFVSKNSAVGFAFDSIDSMALTIKVQCTKDKTIMTDIDKEFRRAVAQLHDDHGRFNMTLRDIDSILMKYDAHLKQCGILIQNPRSEQSYEAYRPGGNTAC